jgi:hypothetical protein
MLYLTISYPTDALGKINYLLSGEPFMLYSGRPWLYSQTLDLASKASQGEALMFPLPTESVTKRKTF